MGLEKQPTGRFNGVCDDCGKALELNAYGPVAAGYKLMRFGWCRFDLIVRTRTKGYLWRCTRCAEKELAL